MAWIKTLVNRLKPFWRKYWDLCSIAVVDVIIVIIVLYLWISFVHFKEEQRKTQTRLYETEQKFERLVIDTRSMEQELTLMKIQMAENRGLLVRNLVISGSKQNQPLITVGN